MQKLSYIDTYRAHLNHLRSNHDEDAAMDLIVGGQSQAIGILEHSLLATLGLKPAHAIVDIGCGSGRLSTRLSPRHDGPFIGTDILPELVEYAEKKAKRTNWRFHVASGPPLPIADESADFVCFFSVFTHLHDEDIYRYLTDAKRILKKTGRLVFSYLDFAVPSHWTIFEQSLANNTPTPVLNKFISKDAITSWASHLDLNVEHLYDGPEEWITLLEDITYADGRHASGTTSFGQSIAVLSSKRTS